MQLIRFGILAVCLALSAAAPASAAEPTRHAITLKLDPEAGAVAVHDIIVLVGRKAMAFHLAPWMRVTDLRLDGRPVSALPAPGDIALNLPDTGPHEVAVTAQGTVPGRDAGGQAHRAAAGPVAGPDGVYLPAWAGWFPDTREDDIAYDLTIETPPGFRAIATGRLVSESLGDSGNSADFSQGPDGERPTVFAGPYTVAEKTIADVRIRTYFHPEAAALADGYIEAAGGYIRDFAALIGPYPFADFDIISAPLPVGLGFPGLTYIDRRILPLPFLKARSLAHEVLHNWWGNGVFPDYRNGNWSEGLTTYMADHALAARRDPAEAAQMRLSWLRDFAALPAAEDVPVTQFIAKAHDATQVVGYGKVAFIFHMLRHEIGDDAFYAALRRFWEQHKFAVAGWPELRQAFETASGRDLGWFFDQWTQRAGAPELSVADAVIAPRESGYAVDLTLAQSSPPYRLKVPVAVETEAGTVRTDVLLTDARTTATIDLQAKPVSLRVDPDNTLFRRLLPGEAPPILRDVLLDRTAATLILYDRPDLEGLARQLAGRLFDATSRLNVADPAAPPDTPLLVIGPAPKVEALLSRFGVTRPAEIEGKGAARAWTARRDGAEGNAVLFIEAQDADALASIARRLPHYRSKSYVIFDATGHAAENGVFPPSAAGLTQRFE